MKKLPARLLLAFILLLAPHGYAAEAELPLDLIELLGELEDEDNESMAAAMLEIESTSIKPIPPPKEVKK